ncbi:DnaB-like helicase C-terminal domain-containing protein [Streptomyces sp. NBC_00887]|uniref:DnaB-like helicase C-terminal domain-containing protein n=1 Tax=Streptomyces sp. NBC_00887 TaxID=2975859 RepID=UPI002F90BC60|nr:AAA family ATPase [Streptomyces sp. NBC_00887]
MSSTQNLPGQHPAARLDESRRDTEPEPGFLRMPPQNMEAEQATIGTLMSTMGAAQRYFAEILETGIVAEEYYKPAHAMIHRAICDLRQAGEAVDVVTVAAELVQRGELTKVGGAAYLHSCIQAVPTIANGPRYAEIVRAKAYRRAAIESAQKILQYAYSEEGDEVDVRGLVEKELTAIVAGTPGLSAAPPVVDDIYLDYVDELEEIQKGRQIGLSYGLADLDTITSGMRPGNVTVIAAQSGVGKSTLALNAATAAAKAGARVMFSSLEMSSTELLQKIVAAEGMIPMHHLTRQGGLTPDGWKEVERLGRELFKTLPLRIHRPDHAALRDIESAARACVRKDGLDVLVVDYLQLVEVEQTRNITREQAVAAVSRGLKNLSVDLECHVIALSQLNDDGMVRESRAIKNDASVVIKVERPDVDEPESPRAGEVDLVIEKNRFGPRATVSAAAQLHYSRFIDMQSA